MRCSAQTIHSQLNKTGGKGDTMGIISAVQGKVAYATQAVREGYGAYLADKPVSTSKALSEIRQGYLQHVHNPVIGSFTGGRVATGKKSMSKQQYKQEMALLKQRAKNIKAAKSTSPAQIEPPSSHMFGNYELNFTGKKPDQFNSFDINKMFR